MTLRRFSHSRTVCALAGLLMVLALVAAPRRAGARGNPRRKLPQLSTLYIGGVEARLARQGTGRKERLLAPVASDPAKRGIACAGAQLIVETIAPPTSMDLPGALLHHWRGTAFAAGATGADFERLMKDFNAYPQHFSPQVLRAKGLPQQDDGRHDRFQGVMRVRQQHVITVVMDMTYDVRFGRLDAQHGYSISRSTQISEIGSPGTGAEHVLSSSQEHGFLWRLNTYWSYEERDGGLYMQIESVSLTRGPFHSGSLGRLGRLWRSVPARFAWPPTLRATCNALAGNSATTSAPGGEEF